MKVITKGSGSPVVGLVACVHGDEAAGNVPVFSTFARCMPLNGTFKVVLANEEALQIGKRFIDADLNRVFPGNQYGNHEERLAAELTGVLKDCDYVIDFHTTTADTDDFAIATRKDPETLMLIGLTGLDKVVFMEPHIAKGRSLIDNVRCGVSVEFQRHRPAAAIVEYMSFALGGLRVLPGIRIAVSQAYYSVFDVIQKGELKGEVRNFEDRGRGFCPVLFGETAYKEIDGFKARYLGRSNPIMTTVYESVGRR